MIRGANDFLQDDTYWIKTYPITLLHWLAVRWHYRWMKVRERDLRQILAHIDEQC